MKPRVLFVSRERFRLPVEGAQARKWSAIAEVFDHRVLAASAVGHPAHADRFVLVGPARPRRLDGALFYLLLPLRIARELRRFHPQAAIVQGVHELSAFLLARLITRSRTRAILDVQGDWRTVTRLYGSPLRRLLTPLNDALGVLAVRRADGLRVISSHAAALVRGLGREPSALFPPYVDATAFAIRPPKPLPEHPGALFVGVLEPYKNVDGLERAWAEVARRLPEARLHLVGDGTMTATAGRLVRDHRARWDRLLDAEGVAKAMDASWLLVLPSRREGLGRVLIEAACRGRALVGSDAGGIPDVVEDGVNGLLVNPDRPDELADALIRVLGDRSLAERLGTAARATGEAWTATPQEFAARLERLVLDTLAK